MAAQEVREYRNLSKKLVDIEERGRLLKTLLTRKIGLNEEEHFVQKELVKMKGVNGNISKIRFNQRKKIIALSMKYKVKVIVNMISMSLTLCLGVPLLFCLI